MALRDWLLERPKVEAALDRLDDNHPVIAAATRAVTGAADREDTDVTRADVPVIMEAVRQAIAEAPEARAEANVERWYENRYIVAALVWALGWFMQNVLHWNVVITEDMIVGAGPIIQAIGGQIFAFAATIELPPIDWRRPWTLFAFRRRKAAE